MSALPHVVWDMGGILYVYVTEMLVDVGRHRGWPLDRIPLGPTGAIPDPDYHRMLAGEFGEPEYLDIIRSRLAAEGIDFDPPRDLDWKGMTRPEVWEAVRRINEAGHRQALLTNDATRWLGPNWWETWEPARWFDVMVDVMTLGKRKPHPETYLTVTEAMGVAPDECLFVDDLPVNCRGAEALYMSSHLFDIRDPAGSVQSLLSRIGI